MTPQRSSGHSCATGVASSHRGPCPSDFARRCPRAHRRFVPAHWSWHPLQHRWREPPWTSRPPPPSLIPEQRQPARLESSRAAPWPQHDRGTVVAPAAGDRRPGQVRCGVPVGEPWHPSRPTSHPPTLSCGHAPTESLRRVRRVSGPAPAPGHHPDRQDPDPRASSRPGRVLPGRHGRSGRRPPHLRTGQRSAADSSHRRRRHPVSSGRLASGVRAGASTPHAAVTGSSSPCARSTPTSSSAPVT